MLPKKIELILLKVPPFTYFIYATFIANNEEVQYILKFVVQKHELMYVACTKGRIRVRGGVSPRTEVSKKKN